MEIYQLSPQGFDSVIQVAVERKKMKTCRLKVYPDGTVKMSVPKLTSKKWISEYLESKSRWIYGKVGEFKRKRISTVDTDLQSGAAVRFLGDDLLTVVSESSKQHVYIVGGMLCINTPDVNDTGKIHKLFEKWWKNESLKYLNVLVDKYYPVIEHHGLPRPVISLRKMKTLWGSCSVGKGKITFNFDLTKADPATVEYIVLHELVHFLHPNHSKQFYDYLGKYMPDWKERRKGLK